MTLQRWTLRCYRLTYRAISSLMPTLNTSVHRCLRWRSPLTLKTNNKRQWPLFLYHLLAFCPPRPATSALFQDRNGEDREQGPRSSWVPRDQESFLSKDPLFFFFFFIFFFLWFSSWFWVWTQNNTSEAKTDVCSGHPMLNIARHYLKAVQIIILLKTSYAEFLHASSKTTEREEKNKGRKSW